MSQSEQIMGAPADLPPPEPPYQEQARVADPAVRTDPRAVPRTTGASYAFHHKSTFWACCLSLIPGVGQIYVGYYKLGFIHNVVFAGTIMLLVTGPPDPLTTFLGIFLAFFFVYNIVDAGRRAAYYNMAVDGVEGIELPDDMHVALPRVGGSVGGGVALVMLGMVLLSNTLFGISLGWLEQWWPVAPITLGIYLLVKARQEQRQSGGDDG